MQTILGANGAIARALSHVLTRNKVQLRQVSRNPQKTNAGDQLFAADLFDAKATSAAVAGSDVVYLVVGLKYDTFTWQSQWPVVMQNVIAACKRHEARLVYLDNVYAYGRVVGSSTRSTTSPSAGVMTEATPFNPCSKKGDVKAAVSTMLLDEMRHGNVQALIARAADFYGPNAVQSFPHATVFERLRVGKAPQWIGNADAVHTFTYTPDIGAALAHLAHAPEAFGQTWHLPTAKQLLTGRDFAALAASVAGESHRLQVAPRWLLHAMGLWVPVIRENAEMMYQFEADYLFDSTKIEAAYGLVATPYVDGISVCLQG